jgi:hypothetical protein
MQAAIEERVEADHAAELDERVPAGQLAQRRDREREADQAQRPDAGFVGEIGQRVGAEVAGERGPDQIEKRPKRRQEDGRLEPESDGAVGDLQLSALSSKPLAFSLQP